MIEDDKESQLVVEFKEVVRLEEDETEQDENSIEISAVSPVTSAPPEVPEKEEAPVLISRLLQEMQQLRQENRKLISQVQEEKRERLELKVAKNALHSEIEELTKNLFEEANGMVAVEAQARWNLEQSQKQLEIELKKTRDLLTLETEQTKLLRGIVEEEKEIRRAKDPVLWDIDVFGARLCDSYYDDFFQERSFDCRTRSSVSHWEALSTSTLKSPSFSIFSNFIDECFKISFAGHKKTDLSDDSVMAVLGHQFMRSCLHSDIEPCLAFPVLERAGKLKSMLKKLITAFLKNTCSIEPLPQSQSQSQSQSPTPLPLPSPESIRASPLSIRSFISVTATPVRSTNSSPIKIPFNPLNAAHELFLGSSPNSITSIESCPVSPTALSGSPLKCSLCDASSKDSSAGPTHRFKITSSPTASPTKNQWNLICKPCRDRLVSVASFFTILRHLIQGLHSNRPKLDVYYDFMQAKRYMFYTRSGVDPAFYALSDFEAFSKKISNE